MENFWLQTGMELEPGQISGYLLLLAIHTEVDACQGFKQLALLAFGVRSC